MFKAIALALTLTTSAAYGQRNLNTIMNPAKQKRDSVRKAVRLHLHAANVYEAASNLLTTGAVISAIVGGFVIQKTGSKNAMFVPAGLAIGSFIASNRAAAHREAARPTHMQSNRNEELANR